MHQALYRKWRPQTFSMVLGQDPITSVLKYEVANGKTTHAYLFCGSRGTGKTTCAKILAKAVNCLHPQDGEPCGVCEACQAIDNGTTTDVLEMDAASNTGVDYIRDIKEAVVYTPAMLKTRVYIIDEVHMLSQSAFNALLKTLEEPPAQVIFILATTEMQKIPATILSRCKRFDFRRIATQTIADHLSEIARTEQISMTPDASLTIAKLAQGGMRDAISLLELCAGEGETITYDRVMELAGAGGRESVVKTIRAISERDYETLFAQVESLYTSSKEITVFFQELISMYRDMLVFRYTKNPAAYLDLTQPELDSLKELSGLFKTEQLLAHSRRLDDALLTMQRSGVSKRITAEMTLIRLCDASLDPSVDTLLARVASLEDRIAMGAFSKPPATATPIPDFPQTLQSEKQTAPSSDTDPEFSSVKESGKQSPRKVLKTIPCFADLVQKMESYDHMVAGLLRLAQAYDCIQEGRVYIHTPSEFSLKMLDKDEVKSRITELLRSLEPRYNALTVQNVIIRMKESATANDPFYEIIEAEGTQS